MACGDLMTVRAVNAAQLESMRAEGLISSWSYEGDNGFAVLFLTGKSSEPKRKNRRKETQPCAEPEQLSSPERSP